MPVAAAVLTLTVAVGVSLAMYGLIGRALLNPPAHVTESESIFTLTLAGIGIVCGLTAAILAGRWVQSVLFATTPSPY
jgi:hypothetical protein